MGNDSQNKPCASHAIEPSPYLNLSLVTSDNRECNRQAALDQSQQLPKAFRDSLKTMLPYKHIALMGRFLTACVLSKRESGGLTRGSGSCIDMVGKV